MSKITWLHLSDLHFRSTEQHKWDSDIVLRELVRDVQEYTQQHELVPDLILVSGDIAFSGLPSEYALAQAFFDKLLAVTGLSKERMFVVPGNHDLNRKNMSQGARLVASALDSRQKVNQALIDERDRHQMLHKFDDYARFVSTYFGDSILFDDEHYYYVRRLQLAGHRVEVLGLNSAWLACGGDKDRGRLALGERQVRDALKAIRDADLRIALLHHPFDWLRDFDRENCEALLMDRCDFILYGHLHRTGLLMQKTPDARAMIVVAGTCYETREHRNGYNLVRLDLETRQGIAFLRAWSDRGRGFWTKDVQTYRNVKDGEFAFQLDDYLYSVPSNGDSLQTIQTQFSRHTDRALAQTHLLIPGIADSFPREEVGRVEDQMRCGKPVILTGDAGTGKSGIGADLARSAKERNIEVLLLDARRVGRIQNETELRQHFDLNGPIHSAIERIGRYKRCRFIIDQLDNIVGLTSATLLVDLAIDCSKLEGVEVLVISRKREAHEARLLNKLVTAGFAELTSYPLGESTAAGALQQLGISQPSSDLVDLGRNLLNLELIGMINREQPDFDFSALMDEFDLWDRYIQVLIEREEAASVPQNAEQIIADAVELARAGLNSEDRSFYVGYPLSHPHRRLISWEIIVCDNSRVCRFRHEKLQDFLYAWDATQRNAMPATVLNEINRHRTRNVLLWMEIIYARGDSPLHKQFLKETFHVQ